jgi:hypothetical protein
MTVKWLVYLALAVCLLLVISVFLNNIRWSYYDNGVYCVDKWTGTRYHYSTSSPDRLQPLLDTVLRVFETAGGVGLATLAIAGIINIVEEHGKRSR